MARSSKHTEEEKATPTDTENVESHALFECPTDGCTCSFDSETELQRHLDVGNHVRRLHRESQFDNIRRRYADVVNDELSKPISGLTIQVSLSRVERGLAISPWDGH